MTRGFGKPPRKDHKSSTAAAQAAELFNLAIALHRQNRLAEAITRYRQTLDFKPDLVEAHFALGIAHQTQGNLAEAESCLERAIALQSNYADAHFALGTVLQDKGDPEGAVACYERTLAIEAGYAKAYNNLAMLLRNRGDLEKATGLYEQAIELDPNYAQAHNNLGVVLKEQGNLAAAAASFKRAFAVLPNFAEAYYNLGLVLQAEGNAREAVGVYRTALILDPNLAEAHLNLGNGLQLLGRPAEAADAHRQALTLRPDFAEAHYSLGTALRTLGQTTEAAECFRQTLALKPDHPEASHYLAAVGGAPIPQAAAPDYVATLFDDYAERFDQHLGTLSYSVPAQIHQAAITALSPAPATLAVLDLGCGTGLCGPLFRDLARTLVGVDLSAKMIEKAQARNVYDALFVGELTGWLKTVTEPFDLAIAADVFTYIGELEPVFLACHQVLQSAGHLIFSVEAAEDGYTLRESGRYAHSSAYLASLAERVGFAVLSIQETILRTENGAPIAGRIVVLQRLTQG